MGEVWFVTGGARSGKSRFAEQLAARTDLPVVYIATMEPLDDELRERVAHHRAARPEGWQTVETPRELLPALAAAPAEACVLLDCLSLWVTNRLLDEGDQPSPAALVALERALDAELAALLAHGARRDGPLIIVTNEVGGGIVPATPLGRAFRDVLGRVNQQAAACASRAWLLVSGRPVPLPPADSDPLR